MKHTAQTYADRLRFMSTELATEAANLGPEHRGAAAQLRYYARGCAIAADTMTAGTAEKRAAAVELLREAMDLLVRSVMLRAERALHEGVAL